MKKALAVCAAVVVLAACGGGGGPHHPARSAAAACRDFRAWFLAHHGDMFSPGGDLSQLRRAVAEAPSGHLYLLIHTAYTNVMFVRTQPAVAGVGVAGEKLLAVSEMRRIADACQSVNPG